MHEERKERKKTENTHPKTKNHYQPRRYVLKNDRWRLGTQLDANTCTLGPRCSHTCMYIIHNYHHHHHHSANGSQSCTKAKMLCTSTARENVCVLLVAATLCSLLHCCWHNIFSTNRCLARTRPIRMLLHSILNSFRTQRCCCVAVDARSATPRWAGFCL